MSLGFFSLPPFCTGLEKKYTELTEIRREKEAPLFLLLFLSL